MDVYHRLRKSLKLEIIIEVKIILSKLPAKKVTSTKEHLKP